MKIVIRDDDLSYYANPDYLDNLYGDIWGKCPISFSVIPFVSHVFGSVPRDKIGKPGLKAIGDNKELVSFLKKKIKEGKVDIVLHGYSHRNYGSLYELERTDYNILYNELKEGKEYLEKLFDIKIKCLVAPHDRFSKHAIKAAEDLGLKLICRAFAPLPREIQFNKMYLIGYKKIFLFWLKNKTRIRYSNLLDFGGHKELYSYRPNELERNFDGIVKYVRDNDGVLSLTTHYRTVSLHIKELMEELVQLKDVEFVGLNSLK